LNLKDSFLYLRIRVLDASGKEIANNAAISITNFPIVSLIEKAETYFNDKLVSTLHNYGYLEYLAVLLGKGKEEKKASLLNGLWVTDSLGTATVKNVGYGERLKFLEKSKSLELTGKIYDGIWQQDRYILPNVTVKLKLLRQKADFALYAPKNDVKYTIEYQEAILFVKRHMLNPIVQHQHMAALEKGEVALYPFQDIQVNTLAIPKNELVHVRQWIFSKEDIPKRIVIGLVKSEAYEGRLDADPFNFRHFNLSKLAVTLNDDLSQYALSEFDFDSDRWLVAFEKNFQDLRRPDDIASILR